MGNSLLAVGVISHKYIIVERRQAMKKLVKPVPQKDKKYYHVVLFGGSKEEGCKHNQCYKC